MHSEYSFDCSVPVIDRCRAAVELGLAEICITDHCDFVPVDDGADYYRPVPYFADVERARAEFDGRVNLRAGVEIGEVHRYPEQARAIVDGYPYDFVIGSLHWIGEELSGLVLEAPYFEGKTEQDAYETYFTELLAMVRSGGFDVIGHLDVPKRAGFTVYGGYHCADFEEPIRAVLKTAIEAGIGIEVNTGTARRPVGIPSPDVDVLRWYKELGGEILTIGSDAHRADQMTHGFEVVPAMLEAAGFDAVTCFEGRKPFWVKLG
ncbi:MAG TPA: histidinol-phosphatase HisJ family protein [Thermomicrobiales bacterium]|nr:histidinol-phosphatase HisJ family protein [Thermomicrobiales bacterium]